GNVHRGRRSSSLPSNLPRSARPRDPGRSEAWSEVVGSGDAEACGPDGAEGAEAAGTGAPAVVVPPASRTPLPRSTEGVPPGTRRVPRVGELVVAAVAALPRGTTGGRIGTGARAVVDGAAPPRRLISVA